MTSATLVLQYAAAAAFLGVGVLAARSWLVRRDPVHRDLALAFGTLSLFPALSRLQVALFPQNKALGSLRLALFLFSGFCLLRFRHTLIPLPPAVLRVAGAATTGVVLMGIAAGLPGTSGVTLAAVPAPVGIAITLTFVACVLEPIVRFWRVSRTRPRVQRQRLRALSVGYSGVLLVAITARPIAGHPAAALTVQIFVLFVAPLLWIAFEPPAWLRRSWRPHTSRDAVNALVAFAGNQEELAAAVLAPAVALAGGAGAAVLDSTGRALAACDLSVGDASAFAAHAPDHASIVIHEGRSAIVAPLTINAETGWLVVADGRLTPLFGASEIEEVASVAVALSIALDRVRVVEELGSQTSRYAGLVHALGDLGEGFLITSGVKVLYVNDAYCRMSGYSREELLEMSSLMSLAPQDEVERVLDRRRDRQSGKPGIDHYESALIHKDGRRIELEVSMKFLTHEDGPQVVCVIRDITERKRAEERLRAALEREHEAVKRLESLDEMKNAFLTAVSHELRTPLTSVLGFARTLHDLGDALDATERAALYERLMAGAEKLERLLGDLLDLDRLSRGIIEPRRRSVDLGGLVRSIVNDFQSSGDHNVQLDCDPLLADIDQPQIERVVENLLINAARHTPTGTQISVRVGEEDGGAVIVVEDEGPGVPFELREAIFQPFRQGPSLRTHSPGVGIGLALVRRFVELHGGRAEVRERDGGGASFRVWLPPADVA